MKDGNRRNSSEQLNALFRESFRTLRSNLLLEAHNNEKMLLVTSARPKEGKSTIALNLACSLTTIGKRLLLIDGDFRKPALHKMLQIENGVGFTEFLLGTVDLAGAQRRISEVFYVLPSGAVQSDPQQLLESDSVRQKLSDLKQGFDFVIIDSAPLLAVADTPLLAPHVDGVILVLKYGVVTEGDATQAKERLEAAGTKIIGCVMNYFDSSYYKSYNPYAAGYYSDYAGDGRTS